MRVIIWTIKTQLTTNGKALDVKGRKIFFQKKESKTGSQKALKSDADVCKWPGQGHHLKHMVSAQSSPLQHL